MNNFIFSLFSIFLESSCLSAILLSAAIYRRSYYIYLAACLVFIAISINYSLLWIVPQISCVHLTWNWFGKITEIAWSLIIIYFLKWLTPTEAGFNFTKVATIFWCILFGIVYALIEMRVIQNSNNIPPNEVLTLETMLFQFTLPGLAEEFFYRGVLLGILNKHLGCRWQIFGMRYGFGGILITILFISSHILIFSTNQPICSIDIHNISFELIFLSLSLLYLREKTGSIWPGVVFHNLANGLPLMMFLLHG